MNKLTDNLIQKLTEIFKERLTSVILYGSCAVDNCNNAFSDINTIVVIDELNASDLKSANPALKEWMKTKNPLPLFMDKQEWLNSCDVYPIEYSDIKDRYRILYGENVVEFLEITNANLRLQCEHEVKNLLIKLRQTYLGNSNDNKVIETLIKTSSKSFFALFRAVLRLTETVVPFKNEDVIDKLAEKTNIDKDIFMQILEFRINSKAIAKNEFEAVIQKLINSTDLILKYVDKI